MVIPHTEGFGTSLLGREIDVKFTHLFSQKTIELFRSVHAHGFAGDALMLNHLVLEAGATPPAHAHSHEQITLVLRGELELTIEDEKHVFKPGDVVAIPGNAKHAAKAITETELVEVFTPVREDLVERFGV